MSNQTQDIPGYILAPQQEHLFLLENDVPATTAVVRLAPGTSEERLASALGDLVATHEILRTTFARVAGMRVPQQVIGDDPVLSWSTSDSTLALTAPAACLDARSMILVLRELGRRVAGDADDTAEPLQFADYAEWRRQLLDEGGAELDAGRAWWAEQAPSGSAPRLLFEHPGGGDPTPQAFDFTLGVDEDALRAAAESERVAVSVFLEACLHALVARLSGESDLTLVGETDGRSQDDLAEALGRYAQLVPIRSRVTAETTFAELVDQVRRARVDAARWQDFASAQELAGLAEAAVGFAWRDVALVDDVYAEGAPQALTDGVPGPALQLVCAAGRSGLSWQVQFDASRHDPTDVAQIASSFSALVTSAVADPSRPVSTLALLDDHQRAAVLALADGGPAEPAPEPIHAAFAARAAAAPNEPAVTDGREHLTHGALNEAANRLAHRLRALGVGRGQIVGVCFDRSPAAVVGLLGVLKAGAAFLPLNFEHPPSRLAHQLEESEAVGLVTLESLLEHVPPFSGPVICLDRDAAELAAQPDADPDVDAALDDLAYVMYTSGSTGLPKGVAVTHGNVANYSARLLEKLEAGDQRLHFAVVSALSTDLGYTSVFPPLASGGCIHLVPPDVVLDPDAFAAHLAQEPVDVLKITPSLLGALVAGDGAAVLPRRWLLCGGEAMTFELVERVRATGAECRILNHYGPTETTIGTCANEVTPGAEWPSATVPVGRPFALARAYIVDAAGEPTPVGVAGELLIGGAGVARGYVNRPDETAERFVADPFADGRVYRTGDRARFLRDGSIEFLGRGDHQVKIRGFRVEPGEIEATLLRHPSVRQAAVVVHGSPTDPRLVAYVVGSPQPSGEELTAFLAEWLPAYMIPAVIPFDRLPLTPSGKVDREALPDPATIESRSDELVLPRNDVEHEIAEIWQELLGLEQVGVTDDFFALGGHSLLATQMITRIRRRHGNVPLRALFAAPTIGALAEVVAATSAEEAS